jgi:hypothetical protein
MSIDGPGILESDLAHDVYNEILDLYDAGTPVGELRRRIAIFEESLSDDLEKELYLAASAKAYWEIGHLPESLRTRLSGLVESGSSLALWGEGGDAKLAKARKTRLLRLMRQIAEPRRNPRPRKKYAQVRTKLFSVGDCVRLAADQKTHRGVVCKILEYRGQCEYAVLVMEPAADSTVESFVSGNYYGHKIPSSLDTRGFVFGPHVIRIDHRILKREGNPFQLVGRVDLDETRFSLWSFGAVFDMKDVVKDFERTETSTRVVSDGLLPLRQLIRGEPIV